MVEMLDLSQAVASSSKSSVLHIYILIIPHDYLSTRTQLPKAGEHSQFLEE